MLPAWARAVQGDDDSPPASRGGAARGEADLEAPRRARSPPAAAGPPPPPLREPLLARRPEEAAGVASDGAEPEPAAGAGGRAPAAQPLHDSLSTVRENAAELWDTLQWHRRPKSGGCVWWLVTSACLLVGLAAAAAGGASVACYHATETPDTARTRALAAAACLPKPQLPSVDASIKSWERLCDCAYGALGLAAGWVLLGACHRRVRAWLRERRYRRKLLARLGARAAAAASGVPVAPALSSALEASFDCAMAAVHDPTLLIELAFEGLEFSLGDGTTVLSGAHGVLRPGRLTAIMGPSGCGKSTLLGLLSGKLRPSGGRGRLWVNGCGAVHADVRSLHKLTGFVPQEDVMLSVLSVQELLRFSARMRLPRDLSSAEVAEYVDVVTDVLKLDDVKHALVGSESEGQRGISGGQRKRVNIGLELVADPVLLFLDEPTSGLDSTAALEVVQSLKRYAALGVTVVAVLHQPRAQVFELLDDLLLLAPTGSTAYMGPASRVQPHFEALGFRFPPNENAADTVMDIVSHVHFDEALMAQHARAAREASELAEGEGGRGGAVGGAPGGGAGGCNAGGGAAEAREAEAPSVRGEAAKRAAALSGAVPTPFASAGGATPPPYPGGAGGGLAAHSATPPPPPSQQQPQRAGAGGAAASSADGAGGGAAPRPPPPSAPPPPVAAPPAPPRLTRMARRLRHRGGRTIAGPLQQLRLFTARSLTQHARDTPNILKNLFLNLVAGSLLGLLYPDVADKVAAVGAANPMSLGARYAVLTLNTAYQQCFTLLTIALAISSMQVSLDIFGAERANFWRESRAGLSPLAYLLGKNVACLPLTLLYPYALLAPFHALVRPGGLGFGGMYCACLGAQWAGEGWGHLISLTVTSNRQVTAGVAALLSVMFTGCFPLLRDLPAAFGLLSRGSFCRWMVDWLFLGVYSPLGAQGGLTLLTAMELMDRYRYGQLCGPDAPLARCEGVRVAVRSLAAIGGCVRLLAYVTLLLKDRDKRR